MIRNSLLDNPRLLLELVEHFSPDKSPPGKAKCCRRYFVISPVIDDFCKDDGIL
jgi:hypothetical protein